jgi:epoxyqueuosine reductase
MHHGRMTPAEKTRWIGERARAAGFDLCGVAPVVLDHQASAAESFSELSNLTEWLARGYAGEMNYLHDPRRADPRLVLDGVRSLIVVALNYNSRPHSAGPSDGADFESPRGWISRYAWGDDYHEVIQQRLLALISEMRAHFPEPFAARAYVDTGPILERVAAKYAGLGWLAKNTCLINSQLGSWLFLGVIVTTLAFEPTLAPGEPPPADLCGTCTRCLDACPTQAFPAPYVLDARRCISYLTIELRGAIPDEFRAPMGDAVIGCDICQDVCPWNRKAPVTSIAAFQPREVLENKASLLAPELEWLASLSQADFSAVFRGSAIKRAKWRGLVRNACVALGNSAVAPDRETHSRVFRLLDRLASSDDPLIADHARWALARLAPTGAAAPLLDRENLPLAGDTNRKTQ